MPRLPSLAFLLSILLAHATAAAQSAPAKVVPPDPENDPVLIAGGFLEGHPDLKFRRMGLEEFNRGKADKAFKLFQRAALYADKPSQALVAEMLWGGIGVEQDRGLAMVWMDLAAERGYEAFVGKRDAYWRKLDDAERKRALAEGAAIRAEYEDKVAELRLARVLRRERGRMTGSRLGSSTSPLQIIVPGYGSIDGTRFYDPQFWDPKLYRAWHDAYWSDLKIGTVRVGEPVKADEPPTSPAPLPEPRP